MPEELHRTGTAPKGGLNRHGMSPILTKEGYEADDILWNDRKAGQKEAYEVTILIRRPGPSAAFRHPYQDLFSLINGGGGGYKKKKGDEAAGRRRSTIIYSGGRESGSTR